VRSLLLALLLCALLPATAAADDADHRFRRTTPRADLERQGGALVVGVPGGRAWGVESELRRLPAAGVVLVRLEVDDDAVREAFVRVAYYASLSGRPRQVEIVDSDAVNSGERRLLIVRLDPPPDAVAYRVRVLARLAPGSERSRSDAIRARVSGGDGARRGSLLSRLLPDGP
jgi:hypothetical protein